MLKHLRPSIVLLAIFTILTGIAYPLAMTGIGQVFFKHQAEGSPIERDGVVVGSSLIGQAFTRSEYFWGRPSAAGKGYDARSSSGSNLGPSSQALADRIGESAKTFGVSAGQIPPDLLTASGSGLDPHISLAAARFQADRVAQARSMQVAEVIRLIDEHAVTPSLGFIGEPRVNVLELNLALDDLGRAPPK